jgi:hypothetical protein
VPVVPKLKESDIGAGRVRTYFYRHRTRGVSVSIFAIEESLPPPYKRSAQIEGMSCWIREPVQDASVGLLATDASEVDPVSVSRIRRLVGELEPGWIEAIRSAARQSNVLEEIAQESGIYELNAVAAVVSILVENGELPPVEIEGLEDGEG